MGRGVLTLAYGAPAYRRQARALGRSLARHAPTLPRVVVCDVPDRTLARVFDELIPCRPELGSGYVQKLHLDAYTPFGETLYLDADSLVVGPLDGAFELFAGHSFGVIGLPVTEGRWYGDIGAIRARLGVESIPIFNGGLYFLRADDAGRAVLASARELLGRYTELGLEEMRGGPGDEIVISLALALAGIDGVDDGGRLMRVPVGRGLPIGIDALAGGARFPKGEQIVEPAVVHFPDPYTRPVHQREQVKLALAQRLPDAPVRAAVEALWRARAAAARIRPR